MKIIPIAFEISWPLTAGRAQPKNHHSKIGTSYTFCFVLLPNIMRAKTKQKNNSLKCEQIYAQPAPNNHVSGLNDHGLNWNFKKRSMTLLAATGASWLGGLKSWNKTTRSGNFRLKFYSSHCLEKPTILLLISAEYLGLK